MISDGSWLRVPQGPHECDPPAMPKEGDELSDGVWRCDCRKIWVFKHSRWHKAGWLTTLRWSLS